MFFFDAIVISIHALREEGDQLTALLGGIADVFLSTPSARRATREIPADDLFKAFLSTPSARRATDDFYAIARTKEISIHALREEGDRKSRAVHQRLVQFLSTPSARRATYADVRVTKSKEISIHALREEGDVHQVPSGKTAR